MSCVPVYDVRSSPMDLSEVMLLFLNPPDDHMDTLPPVKPKGGKIYVYKSRLRW